MRSTPQGKDGYTMTLSPGDTYRWATQDGDSWPGSNLVNRQVSVTVDRNGLCDLAIVGRPVPTDETELSALVGDYLPPSHRHLWPTWETGQPAEPGKC